jgi:hypothetical protein
MGYIFIDYEEKLQNDSSQLLGKITPTIWLGVRVGIYSKSETFCERRVHIQIAS